MVRRNDDNDINFDEPSNRRRKSKIVCNNSDDYGVNVSDDIRIFSRYPLTMMCVWPAE